MSANMKWDSACSLRGCGTAVALVTLAIPVLAQTGTDVSQRNAPSNDLRNDLTVAVVAAILGFVGGYILQEVQRRREPRKRVTYELSTRTVLPEKRDRQASDVQVLYKGQPAKQVLFATCEVRNTGNTVVKGQLLRFAFGSSARVLEGKAEPEPPREWGVRTLTAVPGAPSEIQFEIGQLEKRQAVTFEFVVTDSSPEDVQLIPHNPAGDVEVLSRNAARASDDTKLVSAFVVRLLLFMILPGILRGMFTSSNGPPRETSIALLRLALAAYVVPVVMPFARVLAEALVRLGEPAEPTYSVRIDSVEQANSSDLSVLVGTGTLHRTSYPTRTPAAVDEST
jgi:hypothetical protein